MVIDVRLRPPFKSFRQQYSPAANKAFSAKFGLASPPSVQQISEELMLREMDEAGVTFGLATGRNGHFRYNVSNEDVVEMTAHYGGRILGAAGLDCSDLEGRMLINLDSEDEGVLTVGCAGGARCDLALSLPLRPASGKLCTLELTGLPGGHSGAEIHKNIPNANRVLAQCLQALPDARLVSLCGGEQDNAIPDRARAVFVLPEDQTENAPEKFHELKSGAVCSFTWASHAPADALSPEDTRKAVGLILSAPNGVQAMEPDLPGQVRTSLNLGILRLEDGRLRLTWSVRSSTGAEKEKLIEALKALADGCGGTFSRRGDYPAWEYRPASRLRDVMVRVYRERTGKEPVVETIHAGLECGLLAQKLPGLDAVSIGPDMRDIHSPRERLSIPSVRRTWEYLLAVLAQL